MLKDYFKSSCFVHILKKFFQNPNSVSFMTPLSHQRAISRGSGRIHPNTLDFPHVRDQRCTSPTVRGTPVFVPHSLWLRLQNTGRDKIGGPPAVALSKRTCARRRLRHGKLPDHLLHSDRHESSGGVKFGGCGLGWDHGHRLGLWLVRGRLSGQAHRSNFSVSSSRGQSHHRLNLRPSTIILSLNPFHFQTPNPKHFTTILPFILLYKVYSCFFQSPFVSQF